jgi:hypothetical protein
MTIRNQSGELKQPSSEKPIITRNSTVADQLLRLEKEES